MEVIGYKCFNKGLTNRYGKKFSVGKIYLCPEIIKFEKNGNGFHLCKNIEDTFRYFDTFNNEVDVCLVKGIGKINESFDDYNCYYDMYCVEKMEILKHLNRTEIINLGLNLHPIRAKRFVSSFKLTLDEIKLFKEKYKTEIDVIDAIAYYQEGDKKVYERKYIK